MKYIFRMIPYLLVMMFFSGCQQDDAVQNEINEVENLQKIKKVVSLDQVFGLETIVRKVETMRHQGQSSSFPHSENTNYLGTLNLENIISITDDNGNESFTIDIENTESGIHFEKLHLVKYMDGYIASVQRFEPTQTWYNSAENINNFTGQLHNMSLSGNTLWSATLQNGVVQTSTNGSGAENEVPCYISVYWVDGDGQQYNDDPIDGDNYASADITMIIDIVCDDSTGSGGGANTGETDDNGAGSASGTFVGLGAGGGLANNNPPDGTDADCKNCDTGTSIDLNVERSKRKLLRMSDDPKIKAMLQDLRTKALDENHHQEGGAVYKKKSDGTYEERLPVVITGTSTQFSPDYVSGESVAVHMHSKKAWDRSTSPPVLREVAPIPSKVDVFKFLDFMFQRNNDTNEPSHSDDDDEISAILVTDIGTFALTVGDKENMLAADTAINDSDNDEVIREFIKQYDINIKDECNDDACRVREFINFIKTFTINGNTLGIDMYQASIVNGEITGWVKI